MHMISFHNKGSRGNKLERVINYVKAKIGEENEFDLKWTVALRTV